MMSDKIEGCILGGGAVDMCREITELTDNGIFGVSVS